VTTAALYYFDANPLICAADDLIATPNEYDTKVAAVVRALIEGESATAVSEVTILEIHTKICDKWRNTELVDHDAAWARRAIDQLMGWLADGRLEVLEAPPKLPEKAMVNVEEVTRRTGLQLRAWDAAHLMHAVAWSRTRRARVTLVTADKAFKRVLEAQPEFSSFVDLLDAGA
jgi:hypothetical protein